jgi:hypothetical protein
MQAKSEHERRAYEEVNQQLARKLEALYERLAAEC